MGICDVFQRGAIVGKIELPKRSGGSKGWRKRLKHRNKKKRKRQKKGRIVGLKYKEYIKSQAWLRRRIAYYKTHEKKCAVCKSSHRISLHHITYANVGREPDEDLVPLCWDCHENYHEQYGRGDVKRTETFQFIQEEQEAEELRILAKHL